MTLARLQTPVPDIDEDAALTSIAEIARRETGLSIGPAKHSMLKARLARRLRSLGVHGYAAYYSQLCAPDGAEERHHLSIALTTNVSHFFREPHHFKMLRETALPPLLRAAGQGARVRLWSAGCAHGQEAYSLAMTILALMPAAVDHDVRILATDVDTNAIAKARRGRFPIRYHREIPAPARRRFTSDSGRTFDIADDVQALIRFRQHNLHASWPMRQRFDVIFCRNVLIYFNADAQARLLRRFAAALAPGGWLFLGHSEHIAGTAQQILSPAGATSFRCDPAGRGAVA